ncbi:MAG: hypothetical protein KDB23_16760 [Planctomycetales bacterium]|nr:hypothetical protein [Planctomycetales bacterium]
MLNGGVDEDLFLIAGNQLGSGTTTTIDGGAPTLGAVGDTLVFNPGDPSITVNPSDPAPSGQVGIDDVAFGVVDFSDIEALVIESGPRIDIANRVPSINEGQNLSLSVTIANIPQNTGVTGVTWSVAGVEIDNGNSTTLDLSWAQLLGLGVNDGDDIYPILVSATNNGGVTTTETILLEVLDVAPTINLTADATVQVGDTYEVEFSAADPGDDAIIKWLVNWGDGTLQEYGSGVSSAQHIYETPETYDVVVSVIDDESTPDVAATVTRQVAAFVNVSNLNAGIYSIKEGESLHLAGSVVGQPISVSWDLNGDGTFGDATQLNAVLDWATDLAALGIDGRSHAEISIALQATYANGDSATRSGSLIIENVAPVAVLSTDVPTVGIDEGIAAGDIYQVMFSSIVEPASGDTLTYSFDFGDDGTIDAMVTDPQNPSALIPATWTGGGLQDDGFVTIRGIVEDQDGGRSEYTTTFRVNDVAPTVLLGGAAAATEGASYQLTINFSDPGTNDGDINFLVDWGDGSAAEMFTPASQVSPATISHVFVDNDPLATTTISVRASDDKGTYQAVTKDINVANVAPTISSLTAENASGGVVIVEGDVVSLAGLIIDPGVLDSFTLDVDWGDGSIDNDLFLTARSTNFDVVHRYVNDGTYTISATLTDDDLDSNTQVATVVVTNDAPMLTYTVSPLAVDEGDSVTVAGTIADAGENDTHTVEIDWGDGTVEPVSVSGRTFNITHVYVDDNPTVTTSDDYTIIVSVADTLDAASTDIVSQLVSVLNVAPTLVSVETDASTIATAKQIGETVTLTATFVDPAATTEISYLALVTWGDGTTTSAVGTYDAVNGVGSVTATHVYSIEGVFDVRVQISDDDAGTSVESFTARAVVGTFSNSPPVLGDQTFSVTENSAIGTSVGTIVANDDAGDVLTYELTNLPQLLALTATSNGPANGQWTEDLSLSITINDGTTAPTTTTVIDLRLTDADRADNTSLADLADDLNARFAVAGLDGLLIAAANTDVNGHSFAGKLSIGAVDDSVLRLQITGGGGLGFENVQNASIPNVVPPSEFMIDPTSGNITVAKDILDAESTASYTLLAKVTDPWGETDTAIVTINIDDVNEFAPTLLLNSLIYDVDENSPAGTVIDTVEVSDRDAHDSLTFSLNPTTPFAIDANGQISVADSSALDFETTPQFYIEVTATDRAGLTDVRAIVINVNDLDENEPRVTSVVVDDGTNQRSMVRMLTVTFDAEVEIDSEAFSLTNMKTGDIFTIVNADVASNVFNGKTIATLRFHNSVPGVVGGSLSNGNYTLTIDASKIRIGTSHMFTDYVDEFYRFFGDSDGDRDVDALDFGAFLRAYRKTDLQPGFSDIFDSDSDGDVDATDFSAFLTTYRKILNP